MTPNTPKPQTKPTDNTQRIPVFICIAGTNGTGKTYYAKNTLAKQELNKSGGRVLVVTAHEEEWSDIKNISPSELRGFTGIRKIFFPDYADTLFLEIRKRMHNGMLIFDDCKRFIGGAVEKDFNDLLISRKQIMCDMVCVAHSLSEIPRRFFVYNPVIVLFKTTILPTSRKDVIIDYGRVLETIEYVNSKAKKHPYFHKSIIL